MPTLRVVVKQMRIGYIFWLQWVLVTVVGFFISLCWIEVDTKPYVGVVEGAIGGAVIALAQGLILQQRVAIAGWWVLTSVISWGLISTSSLGAVGWIAPRTLLLETRIILGALSGIMVGALLGLGQWLVLKQHCKRASVWILTSTFGWAIALGVGWAVGGVLRRATRLFLAELVGLAVTWVIVAAITGITLVWLLRSAVNQKASRNT